MYAHDFSVCASIDYIFYLRVLLSTSFPVHFPLPAAPTSAVRNCLHRCCLLFIINWNTWFVQNSASHPVACSLSIDLATLCRRETSPEGGADRSPRAPSCYVTSRSDQVGENSFQRLVDSNVLKIPFGIWHQGDKGKTTKYKSEVCIHIYIWTDTLHTLFLLESQYLGHENIKYNTCTKATWNSIRK